jgi:hypothetical protein
MDIRPTIVSKIPSGLCRSQEMGFFRLHVNSTSDPTRAHTFSSPPCVRMFSAEAVIIQCEDGPPPLPAPPVEEAMEKTRSEKEIIHRNSEHNVNLRVTFLLRLISPGDGDDVEAIGRLIQDGGETAKCDFEINNDDNDFKQCCVKLRYKAEEKLFLQLNFTD